MAVQSSRRIKQVIQNVARLFTESTPRPRPVMPVSYATPKDMPVQPTGLRPLDKALDIGGLPLGRITELIGPGVTPISGGTTSIAARIAAKVQRQQDIVSIIDLSRTFDIYQAERCGLVAPHLLLIQPDTIFTAVSALESAARTARLVTVIMGMVTALLANIEPEPLRLLLRRLQTITRASDSAFLFITAPSEENPFDPLNYPVGFPLSEMADVRLWIQNEAWTHKDSLATAYKANLTVIKNQFGLAGKSANIRIKFDFGDKL